MSIKIAHVALLVDDYEKSIDFYCHTLGFEIAEDTQLQKKRWVRLKTPGGNGTEILLSKAVTDEQRAAIGRQAGGRVFLFLHTDNFDEYFARLSARGVRFVEGPIVQPYGKVGVFLDLYGNRIDLIEPTQSK